jgi:hypothetical protein
MQAPLFVPDNALDPSSLLKQMSAFGMGGWWLGGAHMKPNTAFLSTVQQKVSACRHLYNPALLGSSSSCCRNHAISPAARQLRLSRA